MKKVMLFIPVILFFAFGLFVGYKAAIARSEHDSARFVKSLSETILKLLPSNPSGAEAFVRGVRETSSRAMSIHERSFWHFLLRDNEHIHSNDAVPAVRTKSE